MRFKLKNFRYLILFTVPLAVSAGILGGGLWVFFTVAYVFGLIPILDQLLGTDHHNPSTETESKLTQHWLLNGWLYLWVPSQLGVAGWALYFVTTQPCTLMEKSGIAISVGIMAGGGGINVAHELMHRKNMLERALAEILMGVVSYSHFCVEHVLGHHKHVATPKDPATARYNESIYTFLPRTFFGSFTSAWRLETQRVHNHQQAFTLKDRRLRYGLTWLIGYTALFLGFGLEGVIFFVAQSLVAILLLEVINYVEHYGLLRATLENGRYERVAPKHSWNSAHTLTNSLLLNLPRHADHHYLASRPYMILRHLDDSPQLPAGYAAMLLMALVPPLWKKVMNPLVEDWNQRIADTTQVQKKPVMATG